jgi:hypothetical protein
MKIILSVIYLIIVLIILIMFVSLGIDYIMSLITVDETIRKECLNLPFYNYGG